MGAFTASNCRDETCLALVIDLRDGPKLVGRGRSKAEELKISWNLFKQHLGADLISQPRALAAASIGVISCFITTSPTNVEGGIRSTSIGNG
jgi:hypothetical protein